MPPKLTKALSPKTLPPDLQKFGRERRAALADPIAPRPAPRMDARQVRGIVLGALALMVIAALAWRVVSAGSASTPQAVPSAPSPVRPDAVNKAPPAAQAAVSGATPTIASPSPMIGETALLESRKAASEALLKEHLANPDGLRYRNVQTIIPSADDTLDPVNFCGELDSRDPSGAYIGFQRFISPPSRTQIEQTMAPGEFADAWTERCSGKQGPRIWN